MAGQIIDLAGQITFGLTMVVVNLVKIISNPEVFFSQIQVILLVLEKDLSWCNVDTLRISVAGSGKDFAEYHEWMPCPLITSSGDFIKTNKKLFLEFKTEQKHGTVSLGDTDSYECATTAERLPPCESIVDVLKKKHFSSIET